MIRGIKIRKIINEFKKYNLKAKLQDMLLKELDDARVRDLREKCKLSN